MRANFENIAKVGLYAELPEKEETWIFFEFLSVFSILAFGVSRVHKTEGFPNAPDRFFTFFAARGPKSRSRENAKSQKTRRREKARKRTLPREAIFKDALGG